MPELTAAPSINDTRTQALLVLIARLAALDLGSILVYRIDSAPSGALPFLAWQFDILSPLWQLIAPVSIGIDALTNIDLLIDIDNLIEGGGLVSAAALTEAAQRETLKNAMLLHRFRGTPWAVKHALNSLGWTEVSLLEGQQSWGGTQYPANEGWAAFRVMINLGEGQEVASAVVSTASAAVNFFKPARAWLDSIWFVTPPVSDAGPSPADRLTLDGISKYQIDSAPAPSDVGLSIAINPPPLSDGYGPIAALYDGHYKHAGVTYGANEPSVADPALILNGAAILHGG